MKSLISLNFCSDLWYIEHLAPPDGKLHAAFKRFVESSLYHFRFLLDSSITGIRICTAFYRRVVPDSHKHLRLARLNGGRTRTIFENVLIARQTFPRN